MAVLHRFEGAVVRRTIDPSRAIVAEHAHDWPLLSLFVMGGYRNVTERGEHAIAGPSFVFYGRGAAHRNAVGEAGFEQIEIEFDPDWLGRSAIPPDPVVVRIGGASGAMARALAATCSGALDENGFRQATCRLLSVARSENRVPTANWIDTVDAALRADPRRRIGDLAREVDLSPAWIGPAYRRCVGESLRETAARVRVERAVRLLRESDRGLADIAMDAGFCDQSHMNRLVRRVLGRAPMAIRRECGDFRREA